MVRQEIQDCKKEQKNRLNEGKPIIKQSLASKGASHKRMGNQFFILFFFFFFLGWRWLFVFIFYFFLFFPGLACSVFFFLIIIIFLILASVSWVLKKKNCTDWQVWDLWIMWKNWVMKIKVMLLNECEKMSDEWWVMCYEWWVMSDGNWVTEIEWWKKLTQTGSK